MSGRSIGLISCHMSGVRVTGQLTYIPAHINAAGKRINAKVTIPVAKNSHRGTHLNTQTGQMENGRTDYFSVTCWGKLADIMARSCPRGKALDLLTEPRSYMGKLFNSDGSLRVDQAGQAIEIPKISFNVIASPVFGEESAKTIQDEINAQIRPANWNVPNHPDYLKWTEILKTRQAYNWDGQSKTFLFARVVVPQGVQLDFSQQAGSADPRTAAPESGSQVPYVAPGAQSMPSMVAHAAAAGGTPQYFDAQGNPVVFGADGRPVMTAGAGFTPAAPMAPAAAMAPAATPGSNINQVI